MADYIPITDQEIEPEAPITSILQHKLRDNPEAIVEGSAGAPRIAYQAFNTATGSVSVPVNANAVRPGGAYQIGSEISKGSSPTGTYRVMQAYGAAAALTRGAYVTADGTSSAYVFYNSYHVLSSFDFTWLFLIREVSSGDILGHFYSCFHPSYGQSSYFEHPFPDIDFALYELFVVNLTKQEHMEVMIAQMPKIGGGYLDPNSAYSLDNIDHKVGKRGIYESFVSLFNLDFTPLPWITDEFAVMTINTQIGIYDIPKMVIPEPLGVTRIGITTV